MNNDSPFPARLPHRRPAWAKSDALYFITLCAEPRGTNTLCHHPIAQGLWASAVHYAEHAKWWPTLFLLMPDHLHALMSFADGADISQRIGAWKRYTTRAFAITWQSDFFEHRLRHDESLRAKSAYIESNPVRAGLCAEPEEWPYVWRMNLPT